MVRLFIFLLVLLPPGLNAAPAINGALCELGVYQADTAQGGKPVLLYRDTLELMKGIRATGFPVAFSLELEINTLDTGRIEYSAHVVTLAPNINTYAKEFQSPYGLTARLEPIIGKGGAAYTLTVRPLKPIAVDTAGCGYDHNRKGDFSFDPSANADIHFVARTYGDYLWNNIKYYLEDKYETFAKLNFFTLPGKYQVYLCPCPIRSVIWDKRFHTMVDPTRSGVFVIYTTTFNSADPMTMIQAAIYRNYGYAPPFLAEGMAGYLSFPSYDAKELLHSRKLLPLDSMLGTYYYLTADPHIADVTASSFCKYLIDEYKVDRFLDWYRKADDLNARQTLSAVFGKPVPEIEKDWRHYLDTLTFDAHQFAAAAMQSETMFQYPLMTRYRTEELKLVATRGDSLHVLSELGRACLFNGDYDGAVRWQGMLVALDTVPQPANIMTLATYRMMLGEYDSAYAELLRARQLDTANPVIAFNIAHCTLLKGDKAEAQRLFEALLGKANAGPASAESRVLLGNLLRESKLTVDQRRAIEYYSTAIQQLAMTTSGSFISAGSLMWTGIAYLGEGDTGSAQDYLSTALYLETRPFYQAMDYLWLGKTADLRGERDVAQRYYRMVLDSRAAEYHREEAKALLLKPYR
ncbi:hypothetical protein C3F09_03705 [candidate division GN15 bacterium]|uniref:Tetratricopeptide repeat protein n=1 Tax=candidate division GN15 bacterium TaxID=2072418 RepID=A0A855X5E8_9BACT|nr:MAG: hypothetical protein C3F09_03705 [candidate division GN15 bacterium]